MTEEVAMRVVADVHLCMASQACSLICPEVFGHEEDGTVVLLHDTPPAQLGDKVREAVDACPTGAIRLDQSAS